MGTMFFSCCVPRPQNCTRKETSTGFCGESLVALADRNLGPLVAAPSQEPTRVKDRCVTNQTYAVCFGHPCTCVAVATLRLKGIAEQEHLLEYSHD